MTNAAPFIASPTRRLLAGAVDLSACMVIALVVSSVFLLDYSAAVSIVYAAYHAAFFWLFHGQTPGIFSFNMRIARSADGADMPFGQALVRAAVGRRSATRSLRGRVEHVLGAVRRQRDYCIGNDATGC